MGGKKVSRSRGSRRSRRRGGNSNNNSDSNNDNTPTSTADTTTNGTITTTINSSSNSDITSPTDISSLLTIIQDTLHELQTLTSPTHTFSFQIFALEAQVSIENDKANNSNKANSKTPRSQPKMPWSTFNAKLISYIELFPKLRFQLGETWAKEFHMRILQGEIDVVDEDLCNSILEAREENIKESKRQKRELKNKMIEIIEGIEAVSAMLVPLSKKSEEDIGELKSLLIELPELDRVMKEELDRLVDPSEDVDGVLNLPLQEMNLEMEKLEQEKLALEKNINRINNDLVWGKRKTERLDKQLKPLEADYAELMDEAKQNEKLRKERREMGMGDKSLHGRWNKVVLSAMKQMFEEVQR